MALTYKALVAALLMAPAAADITLIAFDGSDGAISDFTELNDPVSQPPIHTRDTHRGGGVGASAPPAMPMPPRNRLRNVPLLILRSVCDTMTHSTL